MPSLALRIIPVLVIASLAQVSSETPRLQITPLSFSEDGVLSLEVVFDSPYDITVYSWRGHIYPLLGFGLDVTANDPEGRPVVVAGVAKVLPKLPHKHDTATGSTYKYPEPLVIRLLAGSDPFRGCADIQLRYDLTSDSSGNFSRAGLDLLRVHSDKIRVCNAPE